jgi:hypothetical protein
VDVPAICSRANCSNPMTEVKKIEERVVKFIQSGASLLVEMVHIMTWPLLDDKVDERLTETELHVIYITSVVNWICIYI